MPTHRLEPMDTRKLPYLVVPGGALAMVLFALTRLIEPLPPRVITLSTGREGGAYYVFAREYRKVAAADGFSVEIQPGAGSVETLKRLASGQSMAGFVQGGTAEAAPTDGLLSLGSLYYNPCWASTRRTSRWTASTTWSGARSRSARTAAGSGPSPCAFCATVA